MEVEAKFQLTPALADDLRARLGTPDATLTQRDVYLQTAGLPVALRVRLDGPDACVTLKAGFAIVNGIRVREELEPSIRPEDLAIWLAIFERLGFPAGLVVEKTRETHTTPEGAHVVIDTIPELGVFCEVEAVGEAGPAVLAMLEATIARLGLGDRPRLTASYRELLAAARA